MLTREKFCQRKIFFIQLIVPIVFLTLSHHAFATEQAIDICAMVSAEQLQLLSSQPLYAKTGKKQCNWSKVQDGIASFDIQYRPCRKALRSYFSDKLPQTTTLVPIADLGDEGLMTIVKGSLGVVLIRKGNMMLQSAVIFLDIKEGSNKQKALWDIYRNMLKQL